MISKNNAKVNWDKALKVSLGDSVSGHPEELFTVEDIIEEAKEDMMLWANDDHFGQDMNGMFFASMFHRYLENIINAYENKRFKND